MQLYNKINNQDFIQLNEYFKHIEEDKIRIKIILAEYLSIFLNITCFIISTVLAYYENSVCALATAIDTAIDNLSTFAVIWRFRKPESEIKDSTRRDVTALIIQVTFLFISAFLIQVESINILVFEVKPNVSLNYIILSLIQSVVFSFVSMYKFKLANQLVYCSPLTLIADGINTLISSLMCLSMAISMSLFYLNENIWYFDGIFGFGIGLITFIYGCHLLFSFICFRN